MFKTYLYRTLLTIPFLLGFIQPLAATHAPLTVVVVVDGLCQDNLDLLRPHWGIGGWRTLSEEAYQTTFTYPCEVYGGNETTATIMTGETPAYHGYSMDWRYQRTDRSIHRLLEDAAQKGINTPIAFSAQALGALTFGDRLRMHEGASAMIYAIGIHPQTTILMAGHGANACCWLAEDNKAWATTTYYSEGLPAVADDMNTNGRWKEYMHKHWTPRLNSASYLYPTDQELQKPFDYLVSDVLHTSPMANTMVIELALALQQQKQMGLDKIPDMLLLELTTVTPKATSDIIQSAEQEDSYLRLNQDLGYLMDQLVKRLGKNNVDMVIIGRPILGVGEARMNLAGMTVQTLNIERIAALTSTYLMALYGHERWLDGAFGNTLYLNRNLIEQRKISLATIQRQVADFIMEFAGVRIALPITDALLHPDFMRQLHKSQMGDVVFAPAPGWQLSLDNTVLDYVVETHPYSPFLYWSNRYLAFPSEPILATDINQLIQ